MTAQTLLPPIEVKVTFNDGTYLFTKIRASFKKAIAYYVGKEFSYDDPTSPTGEGIRIGAKVELLPQN